MILLLVSFSSFSQNATNRTEEVKVVLTPEVARLVIKDLLRYDAIQVELSQTKVLLDRYRDESELNAEFITNLRGQNGNLKTQLSETQYMYNTANSLTKDLHKALKIEKRKSKFLTGTTIAAAVLAIIAATSD